jgi:hypothetical protein
MKRSIRKSGIVAPAGALNRIEAPSPGANARSAGEVSVIRGDPSEAEESPALIWAGLLAIAHEWLLHRAQ